MKHAYYNHDILHTAHELTSYKKKRMQQLTVMGKHIGCSGHHWVAVSLDTALAGALQ